MARPMSTRMKTYLECANSRTWYGVAENTGQHGALSAFLRGLAAGFVAYAWWKDGTQWVGSCGSRLTDAIATINDEVERLEELQSEMAEREQSDGTQEG